MEDMNSRLARFWRDADEMFQILFDDLQHASDAIDGLAGAAGAAGSAGASGTSGSSGLPGEDGEVGEDGVPGPQGLPGVPGTAGVIGPPGEDGEAGEFIMIGGSSGSGTPAGIDEDVQYNNAGVFGGRAFPQFGFWSPVTNGDPINPEIIFNGDGDSVVAFTSTV